MHRQPTPIHRVEVPRPLLGPLGVDLGAIDGHLRNGAEWWQSNHGLAFYSGDGVSELHEELR